MNIYLTIFLAVLVAELGDKTQLATVLLASNPAASKIGVFAAATLALAASTLIAVVVGARIGTWASPEQLRLVAGLGFVAIGAWFLVSR